MTPSFRAAATDKTRIRRVDCSRSVMVTITDRRVPPKVTLILVPNGRLHAHRLRKAGSHGGPCRFILHPDLPDDQDAVNRGRYRRHDRI